MSALLTKSLILQHSVPTYCPRTERSGIRYYSNLISTVDTITPHVLTLNVVVYDPKEIHPHGTRVYVHGLLSEGTNGAFADLEVLTDGLTASSNPLGDGSIVVAGMVHKLYHPNVDGKCLVIRLNGPERQWFMAVPLSHFSSDAEHTLAERDIVSVSGTFSQILHRSDGEGPVIQLVPQSLALPLQRLTFYPTDHRNAPLSSTVLRSTPEWPSQTLKDLMRGHFPYELPEDADLAKAEPAWITELVKKDRRV